MARNRVCVCVGVHTLRLHLNIHFLLSHKCWDAHVFEAISIGTVWVLDCARKLGKQLTKWHCLFAMRLCLCLNGTKESHEMFFIVFLFLPNLKLVQLGLMAKRTNCCHFSQYTFISIEYIFSKMYMPKKGKMEKRKRKTTNCAKRNPFFVSLILCVCVWSWSSLNWRKQLNNYYGK